MPILLPGLVLLADPRCPTAQVQELSTRLSLSVSEEAGQADLCLRLTPERLELCKPGDPDLPGALWVDFSRPENRRRQRQPGRELVVQATKVRHLAQPLVLDATAGLGRDGFLLAAAGCRVIMVERHPIIAALLADGLARAHQDPATAAIAARIQLQAGDVRDHLPALAQSPEVIYLDPMFPGRSKSAKVKQDLRLLQCLETGEEEADSLLRLALTVPVRKIVVKRPLKGPPLLGLPPAYILKGKAIRFDVYLGSPVPGEPR